MMRIAVIVSLAVLLEMPWPATAFEPGEHKYLGDRGAARAFRKHQSGAKKDSQLPWESLHRLSAFIADLQKNPKGAARGVVEFVIDSLAGASDAGALAPILNAAKKAVLDGLQ